jgi:hypothetical protein
VPGRAAGAVEEGGLEDDVIAALHGRDGVRLGLAKLGPAVRDGVVLDDLRDLSAGRSQTREVALLVRVAALGDEIDLDVFSLRTLDQAVEGGTLHLCQMLALQVAHQICC